MRKSIKYVVTKLGRKQNPEHDGYSNVQNGVQMYGQGASPAVPTKKAIEWANNYKAAKGNEDEQKRLYKEAEASGLLAWDKQWKSVSTLVPVIGWPVYFSSCKMDAGTLRTTAIRSYYIHENEEESGLDKLVLPKELQEEAIHLEFPLMQKGDVLLCTANSVYFCEQEEHYNKRMKPIWEANRKEREEERKKNGLDW